MENSNQRRRPAWLAAALVLTLAACSPGASSGDQNGNDADVELLFWDSFEETGRGEVVETLIDRFEAEHAGVTIRRELQDFENMKTIVRTSLAAGTGPDIVSYAPGAGFMGPLVDADLLLPLDEYADQFGWRDRIYPWTFESTTFDGTLYALGHELEYIGVYYNQDIFAQLNVDEPTTLAELVGIADAAAAADLIPFAFANQPGWPAFHVFSAFANNLAGKDVLGEAIFGDVSWTDPVFVEAIRTPFVEWNQAGYFIPSPNSLDYEQGNNVFYTGEAAMHLTGTWLVSSVLENAQDFNAGFFPLPADDPADTLPPGGMGSAMMISSGTAHPDVAAEFVDFLYSDEAARLWLEGGNAIPPVDIDPAGLDLPELFAQVVDTVRASSTGEGLGLGYNIDVLTPPEFNTAMQDGFQAVLGGQRTPEEQAQALQAAKEASQ